MSDLLKKVQSSFEKTKEQITKLSKDLGAMTDLEGDLAKLSDNLQKSASSLRQVSKDHAKFIAYATDLNQNLETAVDGLITVDPKKINDSVKEVTKRVSALEKSLDAKLKSLDSAQSELDGHLKNGMSDIKRRINSGDKQVQDIEVTIEKLLPETQKSSAQAVNFLMIILICQIVGFAALAYRLY